MPAYRFASVSSCSCNRIEVQTRSNCSHDGGSMTILVAPIYDCGEFARQLYIYITNIVPVTCVCSLFFFFLLFANTIKGFNFQHPQNPSTLFSLPNTKFLSACFIFGFSLIIGRPPSNGGLAFRFSPTEVLIKNFNFTNVLFVFFFMIFYIELFGCLVLCSNFNRVVLN